jgi:predicted nucleic acid-binding protein
MVRVLFDTCIFSELRRPSCDPRARAYLEDLDPDSTYLSVVTIGEIMKGVHLLAEGRKRRDLESWLNGLERKYADRTLPIDAEVARYWGELSARARLTGVQVSVPDGLIAATATRHGFHLVTRNTKDFAASGVPILDPWTY